MPTPLLDMTASTQQALALRGFIRDQALAALASSMGVAPATLQAWNQQHPKALLWSRLAFDRDGWGRSPAQVTEADLLACLEHEQRLQSAFSYDDTEAFFAGWDWALPEDFRPARVTRGDQRIQDALRLIARIWPEGAEDLHAHTGRVLWFSSARFYNFSDLRFYGSIFFRPDVLERSTLDIATLMIHEAAHHVLFAEFLQDPLLLDDPERQVYSPLRQTLRPIHGVLQSMAALVRMIIWLHQVQNTLDAENAALREEAAVACAKYESDLRILVPLMQEIRYTEQGRRIFEAVAFVERNL